MTPVLFTTLLCSGVFAVGLVLGAHITGIRKVLRQLGETERRVIDLEHRTLRYRRALERIAYTDDPYRGMASAQAMREIAREAIAPSTPPVYLAP